MEHSFKKLRGLVEMVCESSDNATTDFTLSDMKALYRTLDEKIGAEDDFYIDDLPSGEVRLIDEDTIEDIWSESLEEQIKDCYDLSDLPSFIEIDWEATVTNCKYDGLGHHFNSYNGEEHNAEGWWCFRTN